MESFVQRDVIKIHLANQHFDFFSAEANLLFIYYSVWHSLYSVLICQFTNNVENLCLNATNPQVELSLQLTGYVCMSLRLKVIVIKLGTILWTITL
jgi:hypothetical protein